MTGRWSYGTGSCADQQWVTAATCQRSRAKRSSCKKRSPLASEEPELCPSPPTMRTSPCDLIERVGVPALIDIPSGGESPALSVAAMQYDRCALRRAK